MVKKCWWYVYSFWHNSRTWQTDRQTPHDAYWWWCSPYCRHRARSGCCCYQGSIFFSTCINDVVLRAHKRAAAILRTFVSQDVNLLMRAFITYVRPIVEYNSVVWSPSSAHDIDAVERVQHRFTKRLPGLKNMSYDQRMKILQLPSLELRRKHADLFWCYTRLYLV